MGRGGARSGRALPRRTHRRLRALLAGVGVLLAAALAGGIFAVIQRGEARDAETAQLAQRLGAQALVEEDLDRSLLLARQAVAIDDSPQTRSYLLSDLLRAPAVTGVMHGESDVLRAIAVSPDGRALAVADFDAGLLFFDARTYQRIGEPLPVRLGPGPDLVAHAGPEDRVPARRVGAESVAYSPDGQTVAFGGDGYIRLIDARTREQLASARVAAPRRDLGGVGQLERVGGDEPGLVSRIAFTRDGSQLVVLVGSESDAWISVRDAATLVPTGPPIEPEAFAAAYVGSYLQSPGFALAPGGHSVVIASANGELVWWNLRSRMPTRRLAIGTGQHPLAVSPDARTIAVGVERGIQLVDTRSGAVRTVAGALSGPPSWLLFSPDGGTVVSTSLDGTVALWDVESATLRETLRGHSGAVQQPVFSPDGGTLYTASLDGTAIAWDLEGDRGLGRPLTFTHDRAFHEIFDRHPGKFSPDGRLIALGLKERGIALWDARTLAPAGPILLKTGGEVKALAFTPDGRTLAAA